MPRRCACCLRPTERTSELSRSESRGYVTAHTSFQVPHCASCAHVGKLFTAACAGVVVLAPILMILIGDTHAKLVNDNALVIVVLLPVFLTLVGLIVLPRIAPFRRVGHVRRCVPARVLNGGIELHNRAFAQLCQPER